MIDSKALVCPVCGNLNTFETKTEQVGMELHIKIIPKGGCNCPLALAALVEMKQFSRKEVMSLHRCIEDCDKCERNKEAGCKDE